MVYVWRKLCFCMHKEQILCNEEHVICTRRSQTHICKHDFTVTLDGSKKKYGAKIHRAYMEFEYALGSPHVAQCSRESFINTEFRYAFVLMNEEDETVL